MREYIYKHIKNITFAIVLIIAIVLFNMHINTNKLFNETINTLNHIVYKTETDTVALSDPSYYSDSTLLGSGNNYINLLNRISFGITTVIENNEELGYVIVYDNTNNDSTYEADETSEGYNVFTENEVNISSKFNITFDLDNDTVVLSYKDGVDYKVGNYKLYVWNIADSTLIDSKSFELLDSYGFDMASTATLTSGDGYNESNNEWTIELTNVKNIEPNNISLDLAYKTEESIKYDFTNYFSIKSVDVDSEDNTKAIMIIKSIPTVSSLPLEAGNYTLNFSYLNLNKTINITVDKTIKTLTNTNSISNLLTSSNVDYEIVNYLNGNVTIKKGESTEVLTVNEFKIAYTGIDLTNLVTDDSGNILYLYTDGITIKSITEVESVETVNYIDINGDEQSISLEDFNNTYGELDTDNYAFEDSKVYKKVSGTHREFDNTDTPIRYIDGGKFVFTYNYGELNPTVFDNMSVKLTHLENALNSPEEFNVIDYGYYKNRIVTGDEYKTITGYNYESYSNTIDGPASRSFDFVYDIDTVNKTITFTIVYDNKLARYAGDYDFTVKLTSGEQINKRFTINNTLYDFYVATYVDKHNGSGDSLTEKYPPSNKQYEYYISLRMVKGNIDPDYYFDSSDLSTRIFSKYADLNSSNEIYFYDQEDYVIKILNYKDDVVKYKYSTDINIPENEREYSDVITETLDGTSDIETKYTDAYNLLNNYNYDEDGNIDLTTDNYDKTIVHKTINNNIEYLTFKNGSEEITTQAKQYVSVGGNVDTLTNTYRFLEFDESGDIIRGNIKGSYKTNTYEYSDEYDVTSLFDITINEDETDIDHAIKVLPKTEVPAGNYYVYVDYNSTLYGVGYVNNITANNGIYDSMSDVVIRPEIYPSLWNRNIHMSYLTYDNPEYVINVTDGINSNEADDSDNIYYNVASHVVYRLTPSYIFDYRDITYKLQKQVDDSYVDVDTDDYSIRLLNNDEELIDNISNYNGSYYVVVDTTDDYESGNYRLLIQYTNPNNGISSDDITLDFGITDKYYGINIAEGTDVLEFPHNYERTKKVILEGVNITDFDNLGINVYYYYNGINNPLTKNNNEYSYTVGDDTNVYFTITGEAKEDNKYEVSITNKINVTQIGNYVIEFTYQDGENPVTTKSLNMYITQDQYQMEYENEYPRAALNELSFAIDFTTNYIDKPSLSDIKYVVYKLNTTTDNYDDVSSNEIQYVDKHVTSYSYENVECEGVTCTGKVRFYLNKNKIDYNGTYKIVASYSGIVNEISVTKFSTMYAWDIASSTITSVREYEEDGIDKAETITGIYRDLTNPTITVTLNSSIHTDDINWNVNASCLSTSSGTCDPNNSTFSDFFTVVNTTGTNQKIVLTPTESNGSINIPAGRYALVLYYDRNDYRVLEFDIHNQYNILEHDITFEYGEATIKSTYGTEEFNKLYTNLNGELSIPVTITGLDYSNVNRYVVNSSNNRVNQFEFNNDFDTTHITKIVYNPSNGLVPTGSYKLVCEYIDYDNQTIKKEYSFTVDKDWFDFDITDTIYIPTTLVDNKNGSAIFTIQTKNLNNLDRDEFNNFNNGRMHSFLTNTKVYNSSEEDVTTSFILSVRAHDDIATSSMFDILVSYNADTVDIGTYKFVTKYVLNNTIVEREGTFTIVEGSVEIPTLDSETYTIDNHTIIVGSTRTGVRKSTFVEQLLNLKEGYIIKKGDIDITDTVEIIGTGMTIINPGENPYDIVIVGDITGDGIMSPLDYVKARKHLNGSSVLTGVYLKAADYDRNGTVSPLDYVKIRKALMS